MRFHLKAGHSVETPEGDLQKAPESLLSTAARQPHDGGSIAVPSWPGASFKVLQACKAVSAARLSKLTV